MMSNSSATAGAYGMERNRTCCVFFGAVHVPRSELAIDRALTDIVAERFDAGGRPQRADGSASRNGRLRSCPGPGGSSQGACHKRQPATHAGGLCPPFATLTIRAAASPRRPLRCWSTRSAIKRNKRPPIGSSSCRADADRDNRSRRGSFFPSCATPPAARRRARHRRRGLMATIRAAARRRSRTFASHGQTHSRRPFQRTDDRANPERTQDDPPGHRRQPTRIPGPNPTPETRKLNTPQPCLRRRLTVRLNSRCQRKVKCPLFPQSWKVPVWAPDRSNH